MSMHSQPGFLRVDTFIQSALGKLSFYLVPLAIGLVSLIAIFFWTSQYDTGPEKNLNLRVMSASTAVDLTPRAALARLSSSVPVIYYETRLSEDPFWFSFDLEKGALAEPVIEFPSRHVVQMSCWDAESFALLGRVSRTRADGLMSPMKAGYVLKPQRELARVVCRGQFIGPAQITALQWRPEQLAISELQYHRKSGLLDGGLFLLALFTMMIALLNREKLYVLFSIWLVLNLRVGALSAGWDTQWLGQVVPDEWLLPMRTITIALYALVTFKLYLMLFKERLEQSRFIVPLKVTYWMFLPFILAAIVLPFRMFLPVMWAIAGTGLALMMLSLSSVMAKTQSRVAYWYVASFAVTFLASLSEVIAAALGVRELVGVVNSVTAALMSSLLAALAIAERMRQEHARRLEVQAALRHTYEVMPIGLFTLDSYGRLVAANPALSEILRSLRTALPARAREDTWMECFEPGAWTILHEAVHHQQEAELELRSRDNTRRFLVKARLSRGKIEGFVQDITEQAEATENLQFMANNDPLTKAYNRRGMEALFDSAICGLDQGHPLSLAYLDLDRFKLINDLFGHAAGDEVLRQVCDRIKTILASSHSIGRVGGDEFVIIMPDTTIPLASLICQGVVTAIGASPFRVGDKAFQVRGSIGLVEVSDGMSMKEAVSAADRACREAKHNGADGLVVYERNARAFHERQAELGLVELLSGTDATSRLFLEMQPIMSLKSPRESLNFEVLLRMRAEDGGVIPAGRIIAAAEKSGLTGVIDRWVLTTTLQWIEANVTRLPRTQFINMNLSGASLNDEHFIQDTLSVLEEYAVGARYLCMEITESVALHDLDNTRRFINQIRGRGVRVALDDFGAGYTSFSYLKELPADVLKIDGQFVLNINSHPANIAIVEAIVNLATNLGMKTVAEWAEDVDTARTLVAIGVDYVQGYVVARSLPPEKILAAESAACLITDEKMLGLVNQLTGDIEDIAGSIGAYAQ